ncbi:hypothetical protein ACSBR2_014140 [Camellia fascicularis]
MTLTTTFLTERTILSARNDDVSAINTVALNIFLSNTYTYLAADKMISLIPYSSKMPFRMTRRQFPVRLAYALTINKSQRQSVKFVGVDLRTPIVVHAPHWGYIQVDTKTF